ncbi:MAG TPA: peptidoglycan-binding domain-containing protein [Negativicutes bacterium]|nr:peptidoglycan-binding domain-containing protein [Negativicutes bacterium]
MEFTRNLKNGTSGEDVLFCKQKLLELGFYGDHVITVTKKTFGADTLETVKRFQAQAGLTVDGLIGKETWVALFGDTAIEAELATKGTVSDKMNAVCALALTRIGDLYVWGASGLTDVSDGKIQAMDKEFARAITFRDSQYKAGFADLMAHDCSGFLSWLMRETGIWDDRKNCDGLWARCDAVDCNALITGVFLLRNSAANAGDETHIGLYLGSGKVIHDKGHDVGVVLEGINQGGSGYWHKCGRCKLLY